MYISKNTVRMHDVDMVGILYFPRQFRFVHEALEDFLASEGLAFDKFLRDKEFLFVIVHCEAEYLAPLNIGNRLEVHLYIDRIGTTSFTIGYDLYLEGGKKVGTAKTTHVALSLPERTKIPIPEKMLRILKKHEKS